MSSEYRLPKPDEVAALITVEPDNPNKAEINHTALNSQLCQARYNIDRGETPDNSCLGCLTYIIDPFGVMQERSANAKFSRYEQQTTNGLNRAISLINDELPVIAQERRELVNDFQIEDSTRKILDANGWHLLEDKTIQISEGKKGVFALGHDLENHHDYDKRTSLLVLANGSTCLVSLTSSHGKSSYGDANYTFPAQKHLDSTFPEEKSLFGTKLAEALEEKGKKVIFNNRTRGSKHIIIARELDVNNEQDLLTTSEIIANGKEYSLQSAYEKGSVRQRTSKLQDKMGI